MIFVACSEENYSPKSLLFLNNLNMIHYMHSIKVDISVILLVNVLLTGQNFTSIDLYQATHFKHY